MLTNKEKLTRDFCRDNRLSFFPRTEEESAFIQRKLFELGCRRSNDFTHPAHLAQTVSYGIEVSNGIIKYPEDSEGTDGCHICTIAQFDEPFVPFEQNILAQFNRLAARMEELARDIAEIRKQLQPSTLDKSPLKKPGAEP